MSQKREITELFDRVGKKQSRQLFEKLPEIGYQVTPRPVHHGDIFFEDNMKFFEDITMLDLMGWQNQGNKCQHVSTPKRGEG